MSDADLLAFILRVLRVLDGIDARYSLSWRTDGEYAPIRFFINCNDYFCWGCADSVDLTPDNIEVLEQAIADLKVSGVEHAEKHYGTDLFCCRVSGLRPQGCCYPKDRGVWPLFDVCGPEREIGTGNPYPPGGKETKKQ